MTITAGSASADVTVWVPGPGGGLPLGTVLWSVPGSYSDVVPAVPSSTGVADVFAHQDDGTVTAITSDGTVAWMTNIGTDTLWAPDFQGGLVAFEMSAGGGGAIVKYDGITGQASTLLDVTAQELDWLNAPPQLVVHPDGTVFTVLPIDGPGVEMVVGLDSVAGGMKFAVPVEAPGIIQGYGNLIVAGDGYAYLPYKYRSEGPTGIVALMRVGSGGDASMITVFAEFPTGVEEGWTGYAITNADQGVLLSWESAYAGYLVATAGAGGGGVASLPVLPYQETVVQPMLQAQDGSFVGTYYDWQTSKYDMVAFDAEGGVRWTVQNEYPQMALADGGVIAWNNDAGTADIFDQNGNATGMTGLPVQSWTGNTYQVGSVDQVALNLTDVALSFNPFVGGNPSQNGTAVKYVNSPMFLPGVLKDYSLPFTLANLSLSYVQELSQLFDYYQTLSNAISPTHVALYPLLLRQATASRFLGALGLTNAIVGYVDHGLLGGEWIGDEFRKETNARGLCLWNWCLVPRPLYTWPCTLGTCSFQGHYQPLEGGFTPRAKVVFLAACDIDSYFLAQWHLATSGQALIVPKYNDTNTTMTLTLDSAANEWQVMLQALGNGSTVADAVAKGQAKAAINGSAYTWVTEGDGSVSFNAKPAQ